MQDPLENFKTAVGGAAVYDKLKGKFSESETETIIEEKVKLEKSSADFLILKALLEDDKFFKQAQTGASSGTLPPSRFDSRILNPETDQEILDLQKMHLGKFFKNPTPVATPTTAELHQSPRGYQVNMLFGTMIVGNELPQMLHLMTTPLLITDRLSVSQHPVTLIRGISGAGKTMLLRQQARTEFLIFIDCSSDNVLNIPAKLDLLKTAGQDKPWNKNFHMGDPSTCWESYWTLEESVRTLVLKVMVAYLNVLLQILEKFPLFSSAQFLRFLDDGGMQEVAQCFDSLPNYNVEQLLVIERKLRNSIEPKSSKGVSYAFDEVQVITDKLAGLIPFGTRAIQEGGYKDADPKFITQLGANGVLTNCVCFFCESCL